MKILLATFWSVPHLGGVFPYMEQLKNKLEEMGHEVDLMGPNDQGRYMYIVNENRKVDTDKLLEAVTQYLTPQSCPNFYIHPIIEYIERKKCSFELGAAFLGLEKYDLIHTQDVISTACISRVKPKGTAHVATLHGSVAHEVLRQIDKEFPFHPYSDAARSYITRLEKTGASAADLTITANHWLKNILTVEFGVPAHQIRVFQYGYDIEKFLFSAQGAFHVPKPPGKKVILYAGRLVDIKGVQHLISALYELKKHRQDWVCWIAGSGDMEEQLKAQGSALDLGNELIFLGNREDVPKLMAQADLYVQPSLIENQPLSLIEAQISGLPALVNNAGGLPEMVQHQVNGIVYSNENELSGYLYSLISDDSYRNYLGANAAREAMNNWSFDKGTMNVLQVYHEALNMSGRADAFQRITREQVREYLKSRMMGAGDVIFRSVFRPLFSVAEPYHPVVVDKGVWDVIIHSLPEHYYLPDPSLSVL